MKVLSDRTYHKNLTPKTVILRVKSLLETGADENRELDQIFDYRTKWRFSKDYMSLS